MNTIIDLEKQILALPAVEREQLATLTWESLVGEPSVAGNHNIDPDGIEIASRRNSEIESGVVQTIGHAEFVRQTGGSTE